jgi:two-component system, cell cycle response regulator CtrA
LTVNDGGSATYTAGTGTSALTFTYLVAPICGARVNFTGKEYKLELLMLHKDRPVTKEKFLNHLYGGMDEPEVKISDVFICKARKMLAAASRGENVIETRAPAQSGHGCAAAKSPRSGI